MEAPDVLRLVVCLLVFMVGFAAGEHLPYSEEDLQSETRLSALFDAWNAKHGKVYGAQASAEKEKRFRIFKENLRHIHHHNSRGSSFSLGLTRFADLTNAEFKSLPYFGVLPAARRNSTSLLRRQPRTWDTSDLGSSFDWRDQGVVMSVKDQGSCGSSWAFASVAAIESVNAIYTGELISLSEQELLDCDYLGHACNGGLMDEGFEFVITNGGIDSEDDYPYNSSSGTTFSCLFRKLGIKLVSIDMYEDVESYNEYAVQHAVASQPVAVVVNADAFDFQLYSGGVYDGSCSSSDVNHGLLIVGWGESNGVEYWIVKNSWGTSWGESGYINLVKGTGLEAGICGMYSMPSFPIKNSTSPPPPPPSPPPPPPPPPSSQQCGYLYSCPSGQTCCCVYPFGSQCFLWSCCPEDYPICDSSSGSCYTSASIGHPLMRVQALPCTHALVREGRQIPPSGDLVRDALE